MCVMHVTVPPLTAVADCCCSARRRPCNTHPHAARSAGENLKEPFQLGDTSLAAEMVRLFALHTQGSPMYPIERGALAPTFSALPNNVYALAVRQDSFNYLYLVQQGAGSITLSEVSLAAWGLPAGADVITTVCGADSMCEVRRVEALPPDGVLRAVSLPRHTMLQLAVPAAPLRRLGCPLIADTHVRAGANVDAAYELSPVITAGTSATDVHDDTHVALLSFKMPSNVLSFGVHAAVLSLYTAGDAPAVLPSTNILQVSGGAWVVCLRGAGALECCLVGIYAVHCA
jgi:hypothetical protein